MHFPLNVFLDDQTTIFSSFEFAYYDQVGMETEGFAIYDAMMQLKNEVTCLAFTYDISVFSTILNYVCLKFGSLPSLWSS